MKTKFSGVVQKGSQRAGTLGFPTINIPLADASISGIYAGTVHDGDREYTAALFADPERGVLEAYLLDFDEDLYGKEVSMTLAKKLREAESFSDDSHLSEMIAKDVEEVRRFFN